MQRDREKEKDRGNGGGGESGEDREQSQLHSVNMLIGLFRKFKKMSKTFVLEVRMFGLCKTAHGARRTQ